MVSARERCYALVNDIPAKGFRPEFPICCGFIHLSSTRVWKRRCLQNCLAVLHVRAEEEQ
jgi:hypothetical protein